jgi:transglutaminase-like putative cysteine protease
MPSASADSRAPYIDLQPGWRLRVVTPITNSGTYRVETSNASESGNTVTLSSGADFIGYETAYYAVQPRGRSGVRIQFTSASDTSNGITVAQSKPKPRLFQLPRRAKFVRLLYLKRISQSDHDMAVLGAGNHSQLSELTARVQANPRACHSAGRDFCSWIPSGIAVRPELEKSMGEKPEWLPAR